MNYMKLKINFLSETSREDSRRIINANEEQFFHLNNEINRYKDQIDELSLNIENLKQQMIEKKQAHEKQSKKLAKFITTKSRKYQILSRKK